ncbi:MULTISPECIES: hypothetical protein [unclassified Archaeoglobus]|jgi:uncharacterized protein (DUF433 family)|uniref:hypothetical protein n=1 Tax=unclassified Archaeoglobus TaxID=2643606 RepID=UPI0025C5BF2A|nr:MULTISPECIES: hypothetical protein [unclassified Archaeoglobus]
MEKLRHLLKHWIEHSKEHTAKYEEWSEKVKQDYPEISKKLIDAAKKFREGEKLLEEALKLIRR